MNSISERKSAPSRIWKRLAASAWWERLSWISLIGLALGLCQHFLGAFCTSSFVIGPAESIRPDGMAFVWRMPRKLRREAVESRGIVLENGMDLSRCRHAKDAVGRPGGHFHFRNGFLRWSASDGTDVRTNGRRYELRAPDHVAWWKFVLPGGVLAISLIMAGIGGRVARMARWLISNSWQAPGWSVFIAMLAVAMADLRNNSTRSDGFLLVKGIPESDANGWNDLALHLHEGQGLSSSFENQRPLYSVLLAGAFAVLGPGLATAKLVNALLLALAGVGALALSRQLRAPWAGVATVLFLAFSEDHRMAVHAVIAENAGLGLGALRT